MSTSAWLHRALDLDIARPAWIDHDRQDATVSPQRAGDSAGAAPAPVHDLHLTSPAAEREAAAERDAFQRGYAAGERAGLEAACARSDATLARLASAIAAVAELRSGMLRQSSGDVARLAIAIAERILRRDVQTDRTQLLAMADAALERLGHGCLVTIALHPDDHAFLAAHSSQLLGAGPVQLVADAHLAAGECQVQSMLGTIDVGVGAQIREILSGVLGDDAVGPRDEAGPAGDNFAG